MVRINDYAQTNHNTVLSRATKISQSGWHRLPQHMTKGISIGDIMQTAGWG